MLPNVEMKNEKKEKKLIKNDWKRFIKLKNKLTDLYFLLSKQQPRPIQNYRESLFHFFIEQIIRRYFFVDNLCLKTFHFIPCMDVSI